VPAQSGRSLRFSAHVVAFLLTLLMAKLGM
jgi:hypothetical protein